MTDDSYLGRLSPCRRVQAGPVNPGDFSREKKTIVPLTGGPSCVQKSVSAAHEACGRLAEARARARGLNYRLLAVVPMMPSGGVTSRVRPMF